MAFRQPTYHAPHRTSFPAPNVAQEATQPAALQTQQPLAESQEWVLFSPSAASTTDRTYTTSTARTRTAGLSRISDFGSINSAARSYGYSEDAAEEEEDEEEDVEGEDGELDSLDSHLHEFNRAEPSIYHSGTVLPTHDGLGSFRLDQTVMGEDVQEQLYAFERFNPRRVKRRRESVELDGILGGEIDTERAQEAERIRRIEKWRMEQSRLLVDEIQRETRRRKQSMSSERHILREDQEQEDVATLSNVDTEQDVIPDTENESFWNRITRRVIRDLMGIDDDLLSIIFGESLPDPLSNTPTMPDTLISVHQYDRSSWENKLLERIARELGILVNQLSISEHTDAFSTYLRTQNISIPYAGLPVIPETGPRPMEQLPESSFNSNQPDPEFVPTLQMHTEVEPMPIPAPSTSLAAVDVDATPRGNISLTKDEWERDLDIKMVFRFLRDRVSAKFSLSPPSSSPTRLSTTGTSHLATASTADAAARAARVRQHHPLINGRQNAGVRQKTWKVSVPSGGIVRRGSSSCASERIGGLGKRSGSSRHYWDFGGSVGSANGSVVAGAMGSWGEV